MISVVIPVYNDVANLSNLMEQLDGRGFDEILICDNGSTDQLSYIESWGIDTENRVIRCPEIKSSYYARNVGIKAARNNYILFLDSDVILKELNLKTLKRYMGFDITCASIKWIYSGRYPKIFDGFFDSFEDLAPITACVLMNKSVFKSGMFDDTKTSGSDTAFIKPRGYVGTTKIKVEHPITLHDHLYRQTRYASASDYAKKPISAFLRLLGGTIGEVFLIVFELLAALLIVRFKKGWLQFMLWDLVNSLTRTTSRTGTFLASIGIKLR